MDVDTLSWSWISTVFFATIVVLSISSGIFAPLAWLADDVRLNRIPNWLRWVLVLPIAFLVGYLAEVVPRLVFAAGELIVNHHLLFKPGVDSVAWQLWAPLLFVVAGVSVAPTYKVLTFMLLGGFKAAVAAVNLINVLTFIGGGGSWTALDPVTGAPLWWNSIVYSACIAVLLAVVWILARQKWVARHEPFTSG